jgi:hypothetical protein
MKQSAAPINTPSKVSFLASYLIAAILMLLPFHAVFTTWAGSNFGHLDAFRIWKELLLIPLGIYAAILVGTKRNLRHQWTHSWLVWAVLAYGLLFVGFAATVTLHRQVTHSAVLYSLIINLRFLWFMLVVWAVTDDNDLVRRQWAKIVMIPAFIVVSFGILQRFVLPSDVLRHVGYGSNTIPAVETVDQKLDYRRIQSTLRGANPLGAYLIIPIMTAGAYVRKKAYLWVFLAAAMVVLFVTYSRSAVLGLAAALMFFAWHGLHKARTRRLLLTAGVVAILLLSSMVWLFRDNNTIQNTLFHSDETSQASTSSNSQRVSALRGGFHDVVSQPLGSGPGSAGPASVRNNGQARITENYFLQIGQEVGAIGLALFVIINGLVAYRLWKRTDPLARVLLASLVGLTVINLISHAWADDTLSLLWWGLAGAALSLPDIIKGKHEQKAKTQKIPAA